MMVNPCWRSVAQVLALFISLAGVEAQSRPSVVCGWGNFSFDSRGRDGDVVQVSADSNTTAVRTAGGRVYVNGDNYFSPARIPALPPGRSYVDMDVHPGGGAAVVDDGTVVVWGAEYNPFFGPNGIPTFPPAPPLPAGVGYIKVNAGSYHVLAMRSDGELVAWGDNTYGQCDLPTLAPGLSVVSFRVHSHTNYLFLSDGSVVVCGDNQIGQYYPPPLWIGAGHYVDIDHGYNHCLGLLSDGQVVAWGDNSTGACDVPTLPAGLTYLAIAAGKATSVL